MSHVSVSNGIWCIVGETSGIISLETINSRWYSDFREDRWHWLFIEILIKRIKCCYFANLLDIEDKELFLFFFFLIQKQQDV